MSSISNFKSNILSSGVSRPNKFSVQIELPNDVKSTLSNSTDVRSNVQELLSSIRQLSGRRAEYDRGLNIMCEVANLPDLGFVTTEQIHNTQQRKMPYGISHDDLSLTFIISEDLYEKKILDLWQNLIYNSRSHSFTYYDDFVSDIKVIKQDSEDKDVYSVTYRECYPMNVNLVELSNASKDEYAKLTVVFAYHKWTTDDIEKVNDSFFDKINNVLDNPLSILDVLSTTDTFGKIATDVSDYANVFAGDALTIFNKVSSVTKKYTGADPTQILESVRSIRKSVDSASNIEGVVKEELKSWIKTIESKVK